MDTDRIIYWQFPWLNLASRETIYLNLDGETITGIVHAVWVITKY